jgi:hypothetical protein
MASLSTVGHVASVRTPRVALLRGHHSVRADIATVFDGDGSDVDIPFARPNESRSQIPLRSLAAQIALLDLSASYEAQRRMSSQ